MRAADVRSAGLDRQPWCGDCARSFDWRARWGDALRERVARLPAPLRAQGPARQPPPSRPAPIVATPSGREMSAQLERRWRGPQPRIRVGVGAVAPLRESTVLNLGSSASLGARVAVLPRGYAPATDPAEMWAAYLGDSPAVLDALVQAGLDLHGGEAEAGLFWTCPTIMARAPWVHGLADARRGRPSAAVFLGSLPAAAGLAPDRAELCVDDVGRVRVAGARESISWSHDADAFATQAPRWRAALADLYLWWGHRLYGYSHEVSRSPVDLYLGQLAVQRGLACLRDIGAGFQHVDRHLGCVAEREVA